ncbi:GPO family capsid scaffolding protein [Vibrio furnissii]|uniref:GPO family capsid scaffolding protein n=1 Tax=Vibrio furnissii TaxID=29494 RepID=UPI001559B478|nr:GPO family capsid scaffolding protein [Vibrio furnissii]
MFKSDPICILTAGETVDGREISQQVVDDMAETYNPRRYSARINVEHEKRGRKGGSVLSLEKRGAELWAVLKPNSFLLRNVEQGQLLHTSCEIRGNFSGTGKFYLTGLALTDDPASLGTTEMHLSAKGGDTQLVCTGQVLDGTTLRSDQGSMSQDDLTFLSRLKNLLSFEQDRSSQHLSTEDESDDMNKEVEELLKQNTEQNKLLNTNLSALIEKLSAQNDKAQSDSDSSKHENTGDTSGDVTALEAKVETLSTQVGELVTKLSSITDEGQRRLAGQDGNESYYL